MKANKIIILATRSILILVLIVIAWLNWNNALIYFHLNKVRVPPEIIALGITAIGLLVIVWFLLRKFNFFKMWKESGLSWFSFHPYLGRQYSKIACDEQTEKAKAGIKYEELHTEKENKLTATEEYKQRCENFKEFIQDLPTYNIEGGIISGFIRSMLSRGGAKFQTVVLHDPSNVDDTYLTLRRNGDYFIHNKGLYLFPWKNVKTILHWDINDSRPLEDKSEEVKWQDPRMCARYFYGVVNSASMERKTEPKNTMQTILIIGMIAILAAIGISAYLSSGQNTQIIHALMNLSQRIP